MEKDRLIFEILARITLNSNVFSRELIDKLNELRVILEKEGVFDEK